MNATKTQTVTVKYWRGTLQLTGKCKTYREAMRLASKNQNAYSPRFYDSDGRELHDDGNGLAYIDPQTGRITYVV